MTHCCWRWYPRHFSHNNALYHPFNHYSCKWGASPFTHSAAKKLQYNDRILCCSKILLVASHLELVTRPRKTTCKPHLKVSQHSRSNSNHGRTSFSNGTHQLRRNHSLMVLYLVCLVFIMLEIWRRSGILLNCWWWSGQGVCYWNGSLGFDSRSSQTKDYRSWYSIHSFPAWLQQ